jgi:pimeloyl-ACP methyl ester carboxylesterase
MADAHIHVTHWGKKGPKIVLIHGSAQGSSVGGDAHFAGQETLAGQSWQLLLPDRPGHGRSPAAGRPDDFMLDGAWVADLLGEEGTHLVGHSYGGLVALAAAAQAPERVRSLTLIEGAMQALALDDPRTQAFLKEMGAAMAGATSLADLAARFSKVAGIPDSIRSARGEGELEAVGKGLSQIRLPTTAELETLVASVAAHDIPLLVVTGGWNPGIEASSDRAATLAHGRREVIQSPHHFPQNHDPAAFNALFVEFLTAAEADR